MTKDKKTPLIIGGVLTAVCGSAIALGLLIVRSRLTQIPDNVFGDQHLKTTVALLELHRVRYGRYPASLRDLKFTGRWDEIALSGVKYYTNADRTAYYVEVIEGWVGKPQLSMPRQFWQGTGYREDLKPAAGENDPVRESDL